MSSKWGLVISAAAVIMVAGCGSENGGSTSPTSMNAALIKYRLAGTILRSVEPSLPAGTAYSATLTFDSSNLAASEGRFGGTRYESSSASFSFNAGSVNLSGTNISITIDNGSDSDLILNDVIRIDGSLTGTLRPNLRINLVDDSATLFSSNEFPVPFPTLDDFSSGQLLLNTTTTNFASLDVFEPAD